MFPNTISQISGLLTKQNTESPFENFAYNIHQSKNVLKCVYDFASLGGAVSDISLVDDLGNAATLPINTIITRVLIDVVTAVTSLGSATVGLQSLAAGDLLADTAKASLGIGLVDGIPVNTAATSIKLTSAKTIKANVKVAALTAGKFYAFVEYVYSN